jgi:hypothetical protein
MRNLFTKLKLLIKRYWWLAIIWYGFKLSLLILTIFFFTSCEKEYSSGKNYTYTFSALVVKDQWGIETWGSHHFVTDEKIENEDSFKECYVNYLKRSGLDKDGMYNKIYYADRKNVKIQFIGETYQRFTVPAVNGCQ